MASTLIQSATIVHKGHPLNGKKRDILIKNGKVIEVSSNINPPAKATIIKAKDLHISLGWVDMAARFCDPGHEYKEDLNSGLLAAERGGFSHVVVMPSTSPAMDNKASIEYALRKAEGKTTQALPAGTISQGLKGNQLAELYDMHKAGAIAFTDDKRGVDRTELMHRALEYSSNFDGLVYSFPFDAGVQPGGIMHEGPQSTLMGTKGIPVIAETIRLQRDLELVRHAGGKMHVSHVSSKASVDLLKEAKKSIPTVTASVAAHQLYYNDEALDGFDSHFKVLPPYRESNDRKALIKGLKTGTIDCIISDHTPEDVEHKQLELQHAAYGISALETAFAMARTATEKELDLEDLIYAMNIMPRKILGLANAGWETGDAASFTLFQPNTKWTFNTKDSMSKSGNSPLNGVELLGKVLAVINA